MSGNPKQKIKLLYLKDIMLRETDEEHPLNAQQLCSILKEQGINAERKSIYADLNAINDYGIEIQKSFSPKSGFFSSSHLFELPELRMLMDAVQAAAFIPQKKTKQIINKLTQSVSKYQAETLNKQIYVNSELKSENKEIYYTIDKLHRAIEEKKQISFYYYHRKIVNNIPVNDAGREFIYNPYAMIWNNDKYYLVGNYDKYNNLSHFRLDRIKKVNILNKPARHFSQVSSYTDYFDVADYSSTVFNMYSGSKIEIIELLCENEMLDVIIDKFGLNMPYKTYDRNHFSVKIKAQISEGLISWLMEFSNRMLVLSPTSLKATVKNRLLEAAKAYGVID